MVGTKKKKAPAESHESRELKKCREFWKEFILKSIEDQDKIAIINEIKPDELLEIDGLVENIMDTVLSIIVSQQKVIKEDITTEEDGRKTKETVLQGLFTFNTYCASLMCYLWEHRKTGSPRFIGAMTIWLSRQSQLVIQALTAMKSFLDFTEITYSHTASISGPSMSITLISAHGGTTPRGNQ